MPTSNDPRELYLDLLKKCLTRIIFGDVYLPIEPRGPLAKAVSELLGRALSFRGIELARRYPLDYQARLNGLDHPAAAETMIGIKRLDNLQECIVRALESGVPGDLIETGAWRGGATIFMRAVLKAYGVTDRVVWVADSFRGLPRPRPGQYPADTGDTHWTREELAAPLGLVRGNFARYGLLDDQVKFLEGWFEDTLPAAPLERLCVLRLDGDMYQSTMEALTNLYPKLSVGGFVIVDDYHAVAGCRQAVDGYRAEMGIDDPLVPADRYCVYWQRASTNSQP